MAERPFTQADLDVLAQWDTPTICNGLEIVVPERRAIGFTVEQMVCIDPKAKPIVGRGARRHDPRPPSRRDPRSPTGRTGMTMSRGWIFRPSR